jgi:hypothetical protein
MSYAQNFLCMKIKCTEIFFPIFREGFNSLPDTMRSYNDLPVLLVQHHLRWSRCIISGIISDRREYLSRTTDWKTSSHERIQSYYWDLNSEQQRSSVIPVQMNLYWGENCLKILQSALYCFGFALNISNNLNLRSQ